MREKAEKIFHSDENSNCAQSILRTYKEKKPTTEELQEAKLMGGGKAPENLCGALYILKSRLTPDAFQRVYAEFASQYSSGFCADIKVDEEGCRRIVGTVAELCQRLNLTFPEDGAES